MHDKCVALSILYSVKFHAANAAYSKIFMGLYDKKGIIAALTRAAITPFTSLLSE